MDIASDIKFDFITDEGLRKTLQSDFAELRVCADARAWKAVHVLAGSIIEAILVEYLLGSSLAANEVLKMSLSDLIASCREAGVLTQKTSELSSALKTYRNLIHPGRVARLGEAVDAESAVVAQALVTMIVREVAAKQEKQYGLTAEQIIRKFEGDKTALGIAEHLLGEAHDREVARLLTSVLPSRIFELNPDLDESIMRAHGELFRQALKRAPDATKKQTMDRYARVLREEPGPRVEVYEQFLFRAADLEWVNERDREMMLAHLLSGISERANMALINAATGIGPHISESTVVTFVDAFVRTSVFKDATLASAAKARFEGENMGTPASVDSLICRRLGAWIHMFEERNDEARKATAEEMRDAYTFPDFPEDEASNEGDEVPF